MKYRIVSLAALLCLSLAGFAQNKELKVKLNEEGSHYFKFTGLTQVWLRYNQNNPGSAIFGDPASQTADIGIRRLRFQAFGQIHDRVFVYTQFGQNNLNALASRKTGAFVHDAVVEYMPIKRNLSLGAGLTGWSGLGRYASPGVGSIASLDAPLFMQATNDVNDLFLRKLSVYTKGKLGKFDYRFALSSPFPVQTASTGVSGALVAPVDTTLGPFATFSPRKPKAQVQGYVMYQFRDEEANLIPYMTGTYLGKLDVLNLGFGFIYQADALRTQPGPTSNPQPDPDRDNHDMLLLNMDLFYDHPLNKEKGNALTVYASISHYDFGPGYIRYVGAMNTANSLVGGTHPAGSQGNSFPMVGTGQIGYLQGAYLMKKNLLGSQGTLQPYADVMVANYERLSSPLAVYEAGVNWLIQGHASKMSLGLQNRPVYAVNTDATLSETGRRSMFVLQYLIGI